MADDLVERLLDTFEQAANQFGITSVKFSRGHIDRATYDRDVLAERNARGAIAAEIARLRALPTWAQGVEAAAAWMRTQKIVVRAGYEDASAPIPLDVFADGILELKEPA